MVKMNGLNKFKESSYGVWVLMAVMAFWGYSCKKGEYLLKNEDSSVYFYDKDKLPTDSCRVAAFGYWDRDTVIKLPVQLLGPLSNMDRKYTCRVLDDGTSAASGTAFSIEGNLFAIAAGKYTDTIKVKVFNRHLPASSPVEQIVLEIRPSEAFNNLLLDKDPLVADSYNAAYYNNDNIYQAVIKIDYSSPVPAFWEDPENLAFFGDYTPKKAKEFIQWTGVDIRCFTTKQRLVIYTNEELQFEARRFAVYLSNAYKQGTPILDEDGKPMQMGKALSYPL